MEGTYYYRERAVVDHKVVSPHTYSQCRLHTTQFYLGQVKHMIQSVLLRYQSQTIPSILDYKHLTHETLKNIQSVNNLTIRSKFQL